MTVVRISAADLLRLAAIASVSPEGSPGEVVAILQRTGSAEQAEEQAEEQIEESVEQQREREFAEAEDDAADKFAKPE